MGPDKRKGTGEKGKKEENFSEEPSTTSWYAKGDISL
jgi:hypothetical protein